MKHFISLRDFPLDEILAMVDRAKQIKSGSMPTVLKNKVMGMLFFKQSLRTRTSFESGLIRAGGGAVTLSIGSDTWAIETEEGVTMDSGYAEHVKEAAPVLSRYCDVLGVRSGPKLQNLTDEKADLVINQFARYASVPVINMESNMEHPCQALADMLTVTETLKETKRKKMVFSWLPQVRATPLATPHSIMMVGSALGMDVTVVHPPGYELLAEYTTFAEGLATQAGGTFRTEVLHDGASRDRLSREADILYGKSWGATGLYGNSLQQSEEFKTYADFKVSSSSLGAKTRFMHCLPVRRNLKVTDEVLDSSKSIVVPQAENRMWAQLSILEKVFMS